MPFLAAIPALFGIGGAAAGAGAGAAAAGAAGAGAAAAGAGAAAAAAGTFLGLEASTWVGLAGAALGAVGSVVQGNQQAKASEAQAKAYERQALDAQRVGSSQVEQQRIRTAQLIGRQRGAMSGSGFVADDGTFGDLLEESASFGEQDAEQLRINAARQAWGYQTQAGFARDQAQQQRSAGITKGVGTFITQGLGAVGQSQWWQELFKKTPAAGGGGAQVPGGSYQGVLNMGY